MNTPSSKPLVRFKGYGLDGNPRGRPPDGEFVSGIHNAELAQVIGQLVGVWPHLEESMIDVFAQLAGDQTKIASYAIFRSITAERLRVDIMRTLLTATPLNVSREQVFDEVIDEFASINKLRNDYVHGIWYTASKDGKTYLSPPSASNPHAFLAARRVSVKQAEHTLIRAANLNGRILSEIVVADLKARGAQRAASRRKSRAKAVEKPQPDKALRTT
ncbi:hypothetical protein [Bauldia litoralis]|uniref:hypothetical protein n=1 Tax=Bauldia litoralis TaxID=665467 RepID=UPI00111411C7|nr:hypothetical protein [Bauldia litoralis]